MCQSLVRQSTKYIYGNIRQQGAGRTVSVIAKTIGIFDIIVN